MSTIIRENDTQESLVKPEVRVLAERCAGCQECIIRCPTEALSMDVVQWVAKVNNNLCVGCRQCERTCPFGAIRVNGPVLVPERTEVASRDGRVNPGEVQETRPGFATWAEANREAERCLNCPDPTCIRGCPAHNDIPGFIAAIREKDLEKAQKIITETSCLPDICSRVCNWSAQCEGACNWALAGKEPVAIGKLERFVTDNSPVPPLKVTSERGKGLKAAVIGSGPAGIAAAWELARSGAEVTLFEREALPGGVIQWGIPLYVLPDEVAQRPIKALIDDGVNVRLNTRVSPELMEHILETHDAVVAAFGAPVPALPKIPGQDLQNVFDATAFLSKARKALVHGSDVPEVRNARILILGGSNTAIDVARNALRLGAKPVIIHREAEAFSYGRKDELAEAKKEGIEIRFATNVTRLEGEEGKVKRAILTRTLQKRGDRVPVAIKGTEEPLEVDMVVIAIGYQLDLIFSALFSGLPLRQPAGNRIFPDRRWVGSGILNGKSAVGKLAWEREYGLRTATSPRRDKIWLVGDALTGPSTVVSSMAQGRAAARAILDKHGAADFK